MATAAVDRWLAYFHFAFISGKFYSLFSLLFGIGFSIFLLKGKNSNVNPLPVFYRRLFILLLIGLGHALLLWDGDILVLYALLGMLLPLFRNCSDKTLLWLWVILILSPLLFDTIKVLTEGKFDPSAPLRAKAMAVDREISINEQDLHQWLIVNNEYGDLLKWNQSGFFWRWEMLVGSNRLPKVFGMFLLGLYVGRTLIYAKLENNIALFRRVRKWCFIIGLPASVAYAWFEMNGRRLPSAGGLLLTLSYAISIVPMCLAYTTSLCLLWMKPAWKKRLVRIAPAGRMALTNYLVQSIIGILLFYGIGLGQGAKLGPTFFMPIAIGVYGLQLVYSSLWLKRFRFGPMEWLWRRLTYGKV